MPRIVALALAFALAAGCHLRTDPAKDQCTVTSDCAAGRTCIDGACHVLGQAGIVVEPNGRLTTSEDGGTSAFTVVLKDIPSGAVTLSFAVSSPVAKLTPSSLTFTPQNWSQRQVVVVAGLDDTEPNGDTAYEIQLAKIDSVDARYRALTLPPIEAVNIDNDKPGSVGVLVTPTTLMMTEKGGSASFTVALTQKPAATVKLPLTSSRTAAGTVSRAALTFTPDNWQTPQKVTVSAVDNHVVDGDQHYQIVLGAIESADDRYRVLTIPPVGVTNVDDDQVGIAVLATPPLATSEAGLAASFDVVLRTEPKADVTVILASDTPGEGLATPTSLVFHPATWDQPQTVTLAGVDDRVQDGDRVYHVVFQPSTSADPDYNGIVVPSLDAVNRDNDTAGISVSATRVDTVENGAPVTFKLHLDSAPIAPVTVTLTSSKPKQSTITPSSLTITPDKYNVDNVITVQSNWDFIVDGDQDYTITIAATGDPVYEKLAPVVLPAFDKDINSAGFGMGNLSGDTSEPAYGQYFDIALSAYPSGKVTIKLHTSNPAEGEIDDQDAIVVLDNPHYAAHLPVWGLDDPYPDGPQTYEVIAEVIASEDPLFANLPPAHLTVINDDDDHADVACGTGLQTSKGSALTVSCKLLGKSHTPLKITMHSDDPQAGVVATPAELDFPSDDHWKDAQTFVINGVGNDGEKNYRIVFDAIVSDDPLWNGKVPTPVWVHSKP